MKTLAMVQLVLLLMLGAIKCGDDGRSFRPGIDSLSCPAGDVALGTAAIFEWSASDPDGRVVGCYYGLDDDPLGNWTTAAACTLSNISVGTHVFFIVAVDNNDKRSLPVSCSFSVRELGHDCSVSPTNLDFGTVEIGSSADLSFTVTNNGSTTFSGTAEEACDNYSIVSGGGSYSLGAGESHTVTVRFAPTSCGGHACTVETGVGACSDVDCAGEGGGADCELSITSLDFGTVDVGSSEDLTFTLTNTGCTPLAGTISESCDNYSIVSGGGTYSLDAGEVLTVTVRYSPGSSGTHTCAIETGLTGTPCSAVQCTGEGAELTTACVVSPTTLEFGVVEVGSGADLTFTITNSGTATLSGDLTKSTAGDCGDFTIISGGGPYSLGAGESLTASVRFNPSSCGIKSCTIITGVGACSNVTCTGEGEDSRCDISPESLDFGQVGVGAIADRSFTITNTGCGTLTGTVSESCGEYSIISGSGSYSLEAGQSKAVTVRFEPSSCGTRTCRIETGSEACPDVLCTGEGSDTSCTVSPAGLDFGGVEIGSTKDVSFTVRNTGCTILTGAISESCDDYSIISGGGSYTLIQGQSRTVTVRFTPAVCGTSVCAIETGFEGCADVSCTGVGERFDCDVNPTNFGFGPLEVGSYADATFTISNNGCRTISGVVTESCLDFSIVSGGSYSIDPGESHTVTVRFMPSSAGSRTCTMDIGGGSCPHFVCSGTGQVTDCIVSPASLDFGSVALGSSRDTTFTIINDGSSTLSGEIGETCADYSIISGGGWYSLSPGGSRVVTLRFSPTACGTRGCTIETGDGACSDVSCTGVGDLVACDVSPASFNFGTVALGSSVDTTFTITNNGCSTLSGTISEACADYSIISGGGSYSLSPGGSRVVTLRFSPTACGARGCTIETGADACSDVSCIGMGDLVACDVSPTFFDFGTVTLGSSVDTTFTITNLGCNPVSGTISETCADYSIISGGGEYSLGAGESRVVTLRFSPAVCGTRNCTIETGAGACSDVSCTGLSDLVACVVSPAVFNFGTMTLGSSVDTTFTMTNLGCNPVSGTISETCADYSIISGGGAYSLNPGQSRVVTLRFSPTVCGTRSCTIDTGGNVCSDVSCTGVGEDYGCSVEPSSIDFGSITVGDYADTTFTITNTGACGTVTGTIAEACADFEILLGGGAFTLAPGELKTVTLRFIPATAGAKSCTITLGSDHCSDVQCDGLGI